MDEDPFAKNAHGISKTYHEMLLLMKFPQTKPQIKTMNSNYSDFYYTVIKNREEKENVDNKNTNDDINFNDFITSNHYIGIKNDNVILR